MDLLKALKRTTILTTAALLALGATEAGASDGTSVVGHISASVEGTLTVVENNAIRFGNMSVTCTAACDGNSTLTLSFTGTRTLGANANDIIVRLNGTGGVGAGTDQETGSQAPGIYTITTGADAQSSNNVYVTFADSSGNIINPTYYPSNHVNLSTTGGASPTFTVDHFTFENTIGGTGYTTTALNNVNDEYGQAVTLVSGTSTIMVGAMLHTVAAAPSPYPPGKYYGTFNLMVSY